MATISVCMIVKNEEALLSRCLDCLINIADEIIIVDTGSTDRTKAIAEQYTDKIFDFLWIHDYAAARNFAAEQATMDYIYMADADEIIDQANQQRFLELKNFLLPEVDIVQMIYCNQLAHNTTYNFDQEHRPKLYKRLRTFRWQDPIHESVCLEPVIFDSEIQIIHQPSANHAPRDFDDYLYHIQQNTTLAKTPYLMYAKELFIAGKQQDFAQAEDYFVRTMNYEPRTLDELKAAQCVVARSARLRGDFDRFMKCCLKNLADGNPSAEICYELGEYYYNLRDWEEASLWYYNAAYETTCELNIHCAGDLPLFKLAQCYTQLGDQTQASYYQKAYLTWQQPDNQLATNKNKATANPKASS